MDGTNVHTHTHTHTHTQCHDTFFVNVVGVQQCGHTLHYVSSKQKEEVLQLICNTA